MKHSIVFFGTGPVAAESLRLLTEDFSIEAVITKPRPAHHKGSVPVLELADSLGLPILTADNKSSLSVLISEQQFESKVAVLIDFGIIVAQDVIDSFPFGIVNSHFSLLPEWRGADPITFSLLSGQRQTGVSLMLLVEAMDEGPLLSQALYDIKKDETIHTLTRKLIDVSNAQISTIVPLYLAGAVHPAPQETQTLAPSSTPSYSRKLSKADARLDFTKPADVLEREVRAFLGWPKSKAMLGSIEIIVIKSHVDHSVAQEMPGTLVISFVDNSIKIATSTEYFCIDELQPIGKKPMSVKEFLAGYRSRLQ